MAAGRKTTAALATSALAASAALLLLAANPFPYFKDSGELSASLATSGIAHPTGFPLQHVAASLCRLLPMGSVSWRLSLVSVIGALIAMAAGLAMNLGRTDRDEAAVGVVPALCAAGVWGGFLLCDTVHLHAVNVEVYLPSSALCSLLLLAGWRCASSPRQKEALRWWRLLCLLAGLSVGVHITAAGVAGFCCLGAILSLAVGSRAEGGAEGRPVRWPASLGQPLLQGAALAVAGSLVVLYLVVRASTGPVRNWGDPSTVQGFLAHVSGQSIRTAFSGTLLGGTIPAMIDRWTFYLESLVTQSPFLLPVAALGLAVAWTRSRAGALMCAACLGFDAFFSAMVNPMGQVEKQTGTVSLLVLTILAGHAAVRLAGWGRGGGATARGEPAAGGYSQQAPRWQRPAGLIAAGAVSASLLVAPAADLLGTGTSGAGQTRSGRSSGLAYDIGRAALREAPPEALQVSGSDDLSAVLLFLREVEHRRPDQVHVVKQMACDFSRGTLLDRTSAALPLARTWVGLVERTCRSPDMTVVAALWKSARALLESERAGLAWELGEAEIDRVFEDVLEPGFPCFRAKLGIESSSGIADPSAAVVFQSADGQQGEFAAAYLAQYERLAGAFLLRWQHRFSPNQGFRQGCRLIASAVERAPTDCPSWNNLSVCRLREGNLAGALEAAQHAVEGCPDYLTGRVNLLRYALLLGSRDVAAAEVVELRRRFEPEQAQAALDRLAVQLGTLAEPGPVQLLESLR